MGAVCIGSNYLHCSHIRRGGMGDINISGSIRGILARKDDDEEEKARQMEEWDT